MKNAIYSALSALFIATVLGFTDGLVGITREVGLLDMVILYFVINIKLDSSDLSKDN